MTLQIKTIFNDPTPNSIISLRYVNHMAEIGHTYTDLSPKEFEDFMYFLSLIAKKMAGTWKHLGRYTEIENALVEAEKSKPPIETLDVQHLSQAQDLILELDGFLVQLKSTLDYLAKLPGTIIGKNIWPNLQTFGEKGDRVAKAIRNNIPKQWSAQREILTDIVLKEHRPWLDMAISARDRINHLIGEGIDHDSFIVAKTTINGVETIVVPMWHADLTTRQYLEHTWLNLIKLIEQFTIGFLSMRFKPGYGYVNWPQPNSMQSPIIVMPDKGVEVTMQVADHISEHDTTNTPLYGVRRQQRKRKRQTMTTLRNLTFSTLAALSFAALLALQLFAQQPAQSTLTLERIFSSREFASERFGPARWLEGGAAYTTIEASATSKGADDLIRYDSASGQRSVLIAAEQLIPKENTAPLQIEDYDWSADGKRVLIFTNTKKVWRYNTRGDYWVLDRATKSLTKLGGDGAASALMFAKFSPDGTRVGYVRDNTLFVENLSDHKITQLSDNGSRTHINGTFDWVYEEELDCRDGWRWSPDGKRIAYWQLDATGVRDFFLINNTDTLYPTLTPIPYPKTGETNSAARLGIVNVDGGTTQWLEVSGDPRNQYLARMEWIPGTDQLIIQRLNRLQNTNDVLVGELSGKTRTLLTDKDEAWVDIHSDKLTWLNNGQQFLWISERDGWRHAYLASRESGELKLITNGAYDLISVEGVDEKGGWLYFIASPDNAAQRYLYRTRLDGSGKAERLSQQSGTNAYNISPDCRWAFHTHSAFGVPPRISFVRLPQHQEARVFVDNAKLRENLSSLRLGKIEFFKVKIADGVELDGWLIKPPDFDPNKKYPLLFHVYGEPAGQTVLDNWGGARQLWHQMLAQQGYLIASVDNRGTPAPRGRAWRKIVYRKIGILASEEQAAAAKQITAWPFVDAARVAVWGWSGGGSMTLNLLFRSPEIYKVGMSVAPVSNQRLYDSIYQERYMGLPQDNAEDYKLGSPITFADKLQGRLLLVHGTGDDNVHYQSAELLVNALISANKTFTMMAYPNRSHNINEGANTSRHLHELLTRYLRENMPPGAK